MLANGFRVTAAGEPTIDRGAGREPPNEISSIFLRQKPLAKCHYGFVMIVQFTSFESLATQSHQIDVLAMFLRITGECA